MSLQEFKAKTITGQDQALAGVEQNAALAGFDVKANAVFPSASSESSTNPVPT